MASTRLTYHHRDTIANAAYDAAFVDERAKLDAEGIALARECVDVCIRQYKANTGFNGALTGSIDAVSLRIGSPHRRPGEFDVHTHIRFPESVAIPEEAHPLNQGSVRLIDDALYTRARAIYDKEQSIERLRRNIRDKVFEITRRSTTLEGLAKIWPEGVQFFSSVAKADADKANELEVLRKDLNELILHSGVELQD